MTSLGCGIRFFGRWKWMFRYDKNFRSCFGCFGFTLWNCVRTSVYRWVLSYERRAMRELNRTGNLGNVGGSSPFWQSIAAGIDETPPLPTPQERQQCVAACQTRHTQAITDCVAGLVSLAEDPDEIDAEAAHSTCVSTMVGRFNECMANCWN